MTKRRYTSGLIILIAVVLLCTSCAPNAFLEYDQSTQNRIDNTIHEMLIAEMDGWNLGEVKTEGHIILTSEENEGETRVYIIAHYTTYGFENGVFHNMSRDYPATVFPAVVIFRTGQYDESAMLPCEINAAEELNEDWIREMFPSAFVSRAIHAFDEFRELCEQEDAQAQAYLESIGSDATVSEEGVDKQFIYDFMWDDPLSKQAYITLEEEIRVFDTYPYWIGTRETVEDGTRFIYETQAKVEPDGGFKLIFTRSLSDGTVVETYEATEESDGNGDSVMTFSQKLADGSMDVQYRYRITEEGAERIS